MHEIYDFISFFFHFLFPSSFHACVSHGIIFTVIVWTFLAVRFQNRILTKLFFWLLQLIEGFLFADCDYILCMVQYYIQSLGKQNHGTHQKFSYDLMLHLYQIKVFLITAIKLAFLYKYNKYYNVNFILFIKCYNWH